MRGRDLLRVLRRPAVQQTPALRPRQSVHGSRGQCSAADSDPWSECWRTVFSPAEMMTLRPRCVADETTPGAARQHAATEAQTVSGRAEMKAKDESCVYASRRAAGERSDSGCAVQPVRGAPARRACRSLADGTKAACPGWLGSAGWPAGPPDAAGDVEACSNRHSGHRHGGSHYLRSPLSVAFLRSVPRWHCPKVNNLASEFNTDMLAC